MAGARGYILLAFHPDGSSSPLTPRPDLGGDNCCVMYGTATVLGEAIVVTVLWFLLVAVKGVVVTLMGVLRVSLDGIAMMKG